MPRYPALAKEIALGFAVLDRYELHRKVLHNQDTCRVQKFQHFQSGTLLVYASELVSLPGCVLSHKWPRRSRLLMVARPAQRMCESRLTQRQDFHIPGNVRRERAGTAV